MRIIGSSVLSVSALLVVSLPCHAEAEIGKYQFHVLEGKLMRGQYPFRIEAIEVPALVRPVPSLATIAPALNRIAEVGANSVCFDLYGFSEDGASLSAEGLQAFRAVIRQVTWRRMGAVCRIFGADARKDLGYRLAAVRTAAEALSDEEEGFEIIYWVDGANCAGLVAEFNRLAPDLLVAAEDGGPVQVVTSLPDTMEDKPLLLVGALPPKDADTVSCVLPGAPETYAALDAEHAYPIEQQPWLPDNSVLTEQERAEGWTALFNGRNLSGWTVTGSNKGGFAVRDGAIEWAESGGGSLQTRDRYDDFVLRLEWKIQAEGNSGIFLRAPRANRASKIGLEFQLRGDYGKPPTKDSTGAIYDVVAPRVNAGKPAGEWNSVEITLKGPTMKAILNGETVLDLNFDENEEMKHRLRRGFIALQDHNRYVAFRNIRIKKL